MGNAHSVAGVPSHLLQQRFGLLWNTLWDVESCVTANSCWMTAQQRLCAGMERREADNHQCKTQNGPAPAESKSAVKHRSWTDRRRPESHSTWNNTDHANSKLMTSLLLVFLGTVVGVRQRESHTKNKNIIVIGQVVLYSCRALKLFFKVDYERVWLFSSETQTFSQKIIEYNNLFPLQELKRYSSK